MAALRARARITPSTALGLAAAATVGIATYSIMKKPHRLDSAATALPARNALSFPSSMLFPQHLVVSATEQINHDTKRITFALPAGTTATGVPPGRAILTAHTPAGAWLPVFRPYTPVPHGESGAPGTLQLLVKKYPNGVASGHLHSLEPGQSLTVRGPIPGYNWKPSSQPSNLVLVAGGAGITPIYSLLRGILADSEDQTRVQLLWGVNGTRDIILKDELESLEKSFPSRLSVTYAVSGPEGKPDAPSLGDERKFKKGYVDEPLLKRAIDAAEKDGRFGDAQGTKVFVCGTPAMQDAIAGKKGILTQLGVDKKAIHLF